MNSARCSHCPPSRQVHAGIEPQYALPGHHASPLPRPLSRLAVVKELSLSGAVGKRGAGSVPRKVNVWRLPSAPPVVLPDRRGPRGGLCRCGGAAKRARASDENFQPRFRHATGPAPPPSLIPGAHQVPVRAMPEIMREAERAVDERFFGERAKCLKSWERIFDRGERRRPLRDFCPLGGETPRPAISAASWEISRAAGVFANCQCARNRVEPHRRVRRVLQNRRR